MDEDRRITDERKAQFREVLHESEKSQATIKKYMRDLENLEVFLALCVHRAYDLPENPRSNLFLPRRGGQKRETF